MSTESLVRVKTLRQIMEGKRIDAFIIPGTDPHQSEYSAAYWKARGWISGFNGSAGTAVVTLDQAGLWTDSRYFLQAAQQLEGSDFTLFKQGIAGTPSIQEWLSEVLSPGSTVAIDGAMFSYTEATEMKKYFKSKTISLITNFDPFDEIWENRPQLPTDPIFVYPETYSGETAEKKIGNILASVADAGANALLLSALDEIAWTLNIRGTDVDCNPVGICYAFLSEQERILFIDARKITAETAEYLKESRIKLARYDKIHDYLQSLPDGVKLYIDPLKTNYSLVNAVAQQNAIVFGKTPVALPKSIKNETEIAGFRAAMIRDGQALVRFFRWLEQEVPTGKVTEITVAEKLREFRSRQALYVGESFSTIAGYGAHGAIVHYSATPESDVPVRSEGFLLIDSGAQYLDGTTDITRTVALGALTDRQKRDFTLVLKGHIAIATAVFPAGTRGAQIDVLARHFLWNHGLNYLHGTGHGVGHFLNVHEGPQNIRLEENPTPLLPGMVTSNEPGVYIAGEYGIRTENLVLTVPHETTEFGVFHAFETLTLFPIDKKAIDTALLTAEETAWLNRYHQTVYEKLSPGLDEDEKEWLKNATAAL
ncbi:MAG: aminopeptidase P family protein [Coprobacter sp.]|nr:aminopeptidase P family protein [Coprobacter sp.]